MADWNEEKQKIDELKEQSINYLKLAEFVFNQGGNPELAQGYKVSREMIEHGHELVIEYSKKHMVGGSN